MSALQIDYLLPYLGELTPAAVRHWVAAALAQEAALRDYDGWLYPADPAEMPGAKRLHESWRTWADDAEALLRRVDAVPSLRGVVEKLEQLRDAVGRAQAMLQMTPELIAQRHEQVRRGEVVSFEEVRREVRSRLRG